MLPHQYDRPLTPPQRLRISIGETKTSTRTGNDYPSKVDHFRLLRMEFTPGQGQKPKYTLDENLQKLAAKDTLDLLPATDPDRAGSAQGKPRALRVRVIGNPFMVDIPQADGTTKRLPDLPPEIMYSSLSHYQGGRRICHCDHFGPEGTGEALRRNFVRKRKAKAGDDNDEKNWYWVEEAGERIVCDPTTCPLATGAHEVKGYEGVKLCKPQVILTCTIPWMPSVGAAAKLKTTSWYSHGTLRNSLLHIALQTGGWLHDIDLWLVLDWLRAGDNNLVPAMRFEYKGNVHALLPEGNGPARPVLESGGVDLLRAKAQETRAKWLGDEIRLQQLRSGVLSENLRLLKDVDEQRLDNAEFIPETAHTIIDLTAVAPAQVLEENLPPEGTCEPEEVDVQPETPIVDAEFEMQAAAADFTYDVQSDPLGSRLYNLMDALELTALQREKVLGRCTSEETVKAELALLADEYNSTRAKGPKVAQQQQPDGVQERLIPEGEEEAEE